MGMRILVYGLQSSGATLATFLIGQKSGSVVVPDLFDDALLPSRNAFSPEARRVVAKCTITTRYSLGEHEANFCPDKKVLVVRHPGSNYVSLDRKLHRDWSGSIEEKFAAADAYFQDRKRHFDAVVRYEDLVFRNSEFREALADAGIEVKSSHYDIPRTRFSVLKSNAERSQWCRENYRVKWGFGRLRSDSIETRYVMKYITNEKEKKVKKLSHNLQRYYQNYDISAMNVLRPVFLEEIIDNRFKISKYKEILKVGLQRLHNYIKR
jgi:hypothetical protein